MGKILQNQDPFEILYVWLSNYTSENMYQGKILEYHKYALHANSSLIYYLNFNIKTFLYKLICWHMVRYFKAMVTIFYSFIMTQERIIHILMKINFPLYQYQIQINVKFSKWKHCHVNNNNLWAAREWGICIWFFAFFRSLNYNDEAKHSVTHVLHCLE